MSMTARWVIPGSGSNRAPAVTRKKHRGSAANRVLAERNPPVVAVGAWVEDGEDLQEHPSALALITEELEAERRREYEENLRKFQEEVQHRVAQHVRAFKRRQQPPALKLDGRLTHQTWMHHEPVVDRLAFSGVAAQQTTIGGTFQEARDDMRQVRHRLAACQTRPHGGTESELPGGTWNISPTRHAGPELDCPQQTGPEQDCPQQTGPEQDCPQQTDPGQDCPQQTDPEQTGPDQNGQQQNVEPQTVEQEDVEKEEEEKVDVRREEDGKARVFSIHHECPLVQHKVSRAESWDADALEPDPGLESRFRRLQKLWPQSDHEALKRQHQSHILMQRRHFMNTERERVKENEMYRKHLRRAASIKAEKEKKRLAEERKLDNAHLLEEARLKLEERELQIMEQLRREDNERMTEMQKKKKEKHKTRRRFLDALRARMMDHLSQGKEEPPPLCFCASSFWESHPDTCANNCVFHNNPKAYAQAIQSALLNLDVS